MNISPEGLRASPKGWFRVAAVAGPPSPVEPAAPVPATVKIMPIELTCQVESEKGKILSLTRQNDVQILIFGLNDVYSR